MTRHTESLEVVVKDQRPAALFPHREGVTGASHLSTRHERVIGRSMRIPVELTICAGYG
jgi:hypothetical protein